MTDPIVEILEDFAENLASANEEDNFAQLNKVVTDSVNEAKTQLIKLIEGIIGEDTPDLSHADRFQNKLRASQRAKLKLSVRGEE